MTRVAYNKGMYGEKRKRFLLGLDIECIHHGNHKDWKFSEKHNQLSCRFCLNERAKKFTLNNPFKVFLTWAKGRNKEIDIDSQYLKNLFEEQNETCALSGIKLDRKNMSLDRIDSSIGYVKGNLQWVHKIINRMKTDLSQDEFINLCKLVAISAAKKKK